MLWGISVHVKIQTSRNRGSVVGVGVTIFVLFFCLFKIEGSNKDVMDFFFYNLNYTLGCDNLQPSQLIFANIPATASVWALEKKNKNISTFSIVWSHLQKMSNIEGPHPEPFNSGPTHDSTGGCVGRHWWSQDAKKCICSLLRLNKNGVRSLRVNTYQLLSDENNLISHRFSAHRKNTNKAAWGKKKQLTDKI